MSLIEFGSCPEPVAREMNIDCVRPEYGHEQVSSPEMRYFLQDQEDQGTAQRRLITVRRTSDPADWR